MFSKVYTHSLRSFFFSSSSSSSLSYWILFCGGFGVENGWCKFHIVDFMCFS
jgi:hypothetical protein